MQDSSSQFSQSVEQFESPDDGELGDIDARSSVKLTSSSVVAERTWPSESYGQPVPELLSKLSSTADIEYY